MKCNIPQHRKHVTRNREAEAYLSQLCRQAVMNPHMFLRERRKCYEFTEEPTKITTWKELDNLETEEYRIEVDKKDGCSGWVINKKTNEGVTYLSTHTFYGSQYQNSTMTLQSLGFNVEISNWDAP